MRPASKRVRIKSDYRGVIFSLQIPFKEFRNAASLASRKRSSSSSPDIVTMADIQTHESFQRDQDIKGSSDRSFGLVFTAVFLIVGLWPLVHGEPVRLWSLAIAGIVLAIALIRPALLGPLNRLWMKFGLLLHKIVNPIVMGLVFFFAVVPTAFIIKLMGKDPLRRKLDRDAATYWIDRNPPGPAPDSMKNQF